MSDSQNATTDTASDTAKPAAVATPPQPVFPILPDPVQQINEFDRALATLAAEEKALRDELAVKDPLESTEDTLEYATELLLIIRAISKIKLERGAAIRRLAGGLGI